MAFVPMSKLTDVRIFGTALHFLEVRTRVPLKFGPEILTEVSVARVMVRVENRRGVKARGWGETPLSVQWVWPSMLSSQDRRVALKEFCFVLAKAWAEEPARGHAFEIGHDFQRDKLPQLWSHFNEARRKGLEPMPWLAALVCCSAFDLALHDAYGIASEVPVYSTYGERFMNRDLAAYLEPETNSGISFQGVYPDSYLAITPAQRLRAWHLVGGVDPLCAADLTGREPQDGQPVVLRDWIRTDGLKCLKVKLRGTDAGWDFNRMIAVGAIAAEEGVEWLSADFNCTVRDPAYVTEILDRLRDQHPRVYGSLLYVEQPFPYELEKFAIPAHSVSARKPLFLDESAHDWRHVRLGRSLGWNGVALKTCKTQTGALLSACWARAHGMTLMVQDLTNPMLAQIPHVLLAAHVGTIMGVETNSMQFYPDASKPEARVHPSLYRRRRGEVSLETVSGHGFGMRVAEIQRSLPEPVAVYESESGG